MFDRRLPQGHPLPERKLSQDAGYEITIDHPAFEIVAGVIHPEGHQRPREPLAPAQQIDAMVLGDRQEPGARPFFLRIRCQRVERDEKDLVGCVGGVLRSLQEGGTPLEDSGEIRFIEVRKPALLVGGHRARLPTPTLRSNGKLRWRTRVSHLSLH